MGGCNCATIKRCSQCCDNCGNCGRSVPKQAKLVNLLHPASTQLYLCLLKYGLLFKMLGQEALSMINQRSSLSLFFLHLTPSFPPRLVSNAPCISAANITVYRIAVVCLGKLTFYACVIIAP